MLAGMRTSTRLDILYHARACTRFPDESIVSGNNLASFAFKSWICALVQVQTQSSQFKSWIRALVQIQIESSNSN